MGATIKLSGAGAVPPTMSTKTNRLIRSLIMILTNNNLMSEPWGLISL